MRGHIEAVTTSINDDRLDHAVEHVMHMVLEAMAKPHISSEIDDAIVRMQLGERHGAPSAIEHADRRIEYADPGPAIFAAVYDTERRCFASPEQAVERANEAARAYYKAVNGE